MTVVNYTVNQKNSDFVNVSLALARYGKVRWYYDLSTKQTNTLCCC
jgi:hypothetical protein